jgi:translocation protein SEC63
MSKVQLLKQNAPHKKVNDRLIKAVFVIFWAILIFLAYQASQIKTEHKEYDPYAILNIGRGATNKEIKKQYREMSKVMHPDQGGVEEDFRELSKAYKALTDEETRKNWEEYGNPDGPGATQFGIALPKWIVEGKNSYIVLGLYVLVFMVIMPTLVGMWWYKSIKYTGDQILMRTSQLYYHCLMKTPQLILKRAIMVLGSSFEYEKSSNPEIIERPTDNVEMPALMRDLPDLQEKIREMPYSYLFSIKARALIHAQLMRVDLPADTLQKDKNAVLRKAPFLLNEMVNVVSNLVATAGQPGVPKNFHPPQLETLENIMKLSPMIVQALWDKNKKQTLLQLPHLVENHLRHFVTKKRNICDIKQFVQTKDADRRSILRHLTDEQYEDVINVCASYPLIDMSVKTEVFDDEDDQIITAGAIVTVVVNLRRQSLSVLFENEEMNEINKDDAENDENKDECEIEDLGSIEGTKTTSPPAKKNNNNKKSNQKKPLTKKHEPKKVIVEKLEKEKNSDSEKEDGSNDDSNSEKKNTSKSGDEYFEKFQQIQKKKEALVTKEKVSHRVYCPYFPEIKQEYWWLYIADRKKKQIISAPTQICSLKDTEEVELKFLAPKIPGTYSYSVTLKSDSYLDFDVNQIFKLEVQPAKKIEEHPQWDFSDEEDNGDKEGASDSEFATESESEAD